MLSFYLSLLDTPEEKSKFEQLYLAYRQDMYKTAYGILNDSFEAEDAVHEAFMIVVKNLTKISEINCPQTHAYLIIIVKNIALKMIKNMNRRADAEPLEIPDDFSLEDSVISNMNTECIIKILERLPDDYYEILFLNIFMEYDISEISELLSITYDNAKKRLQRAKNKFRKIAEEEFANAE